MSSKDKKESVSDITYIESLLLSGFRGIGFVFNYFNINSILSLIQTIIITLFQYWLSFIVILWSSAFIYSMFYYIYIPLVLTTKEVYFQFDSTCDTLLNTKCAIPFAQIPLSQYSSDGQFLRGQKYRFDIDLHLPESDVNWSQGIFMIRIKLFDDNQQIVRNVAKPSILRYKSLLTRLINTMFYWPLLVIDVMEESQTLSVALIEDFIEGSHPDVGPVTHAVIEIEARDIQISPPTLLRISAHLTGLRYYMYYWPFTTASFGISTIYFFIYFLTLISSSTHSTKDQNNGIEDKSEFDEQFNDSNEVFLNNSDSFLTTNHRYESESEGSSTSIIHEIQDFDIHNEDSNQVPDSSVE